MRCLCMTACTSEEMHLLFITGGMPSLSLPHLLTSRLSTLVLLRISLLSFLREDASLGSICGYCGWPAHLASGGPGATCSGRRLVHAAYTEDA